MSTPKYILCKIWVRYNGVTWDDGVTNVHNNYGKMCPKPPHFKNVFVKDSWIVTLQEKTMFDIIFILNITFLKPMAISCPEYN